MREKEEKTELAVIDKETQLAARHARILELEQRLANPDPLSKEEYIGLLKEIQKNYTIQLTLNSVSGKNKGVGAALTVVDKIHYLVKSIEDKQPPVSPIVVSLDILDTEEMLALRAMVVKLKGGKDDH